jgi:preprotein translocase subunit SecY
MSATLNERNPNVDRIEIGTMTTGAGLSAGIVIPGIYFRKHSRIKNVYYADTSAIAKSSSNYLTLKLQDNSSTPVVYASAVTSAAAVVAVTQYPLALTTPDVTLEDPTAPASQQEEDVPAGTMLNVSIAALGTAVPTNAAILVEWYPC